MMKFSGLFLAVAAPNAVVSLKVKSAAQSRSVGIQMLSSRDGADRFEANALRKAFKVKVDPKNKSRLEVHDGSIHADDKHRVFNLDVPTDPTEALKNTTVTYVGKRSEKHGQYNDMVLQSIGGCPLSIIFEQHAASGDPVMRLKTHFQTEPIGTFVFMKKVRDDDKLNLCTSGPNPFLAKGDYMSSFHDSYGNKYEFLKVYEKREHVFSFCIPANPTEAVENVIAVRVGERFQNQGLDEGMSLHSIGGKPLSKIFGYYAQHYNNHYSPVTALQHCFERESPRDIVFKTNLLSVAQPHDDEEDFEQLSVDGSIVGEPIAREEAIPLRAEITPHAESTEQDKEQDPVQEVQEQEEEEEKGQENADEQQPRNGGCWGFFRRSGRSIWNWFRNLRNPFRRSA